MTTEEKLDAALTLLADWAIAVNTKGTMWDDWGNHYKDVMYGRNPIAELVDAKIKERQESDFWR